MILLFVLVPPALVFAAFIVWANFIKPPGAHAFADPADTTDPDGAAYIGALTDDPDEDVWEKRASEMATGTGQFPMLPEPDPDPTIVQPADVKYLGKPSAELVDELFAKHAPEPDVIA